MEDECYTVGDFVLSFTDVEGSVDEELANDSSNSQRILSLSEKEQNITISTNDCDSQEASTEQIFPQIVCKKRRLSENEDFQDQPKKKKIDFKSIEKKSLRVKLERLPVVEKLLIEHQQKQLSKNTLKMWTGWKAPTPTLRETLKHLQRIISHTEQLYRGVLATRIFEAEQTTSSPKFVEDNKIVPSQTNLLTVPVDIKSNLGEDSTVNKCHTEELIKEDCGLRGFDLDTLSGNCRGFPAPSTKSRDELNQRIKRLEGNISLVTMLEEVDKDVSPCCKAEQYDYKPVYKATLKEAKQENKVKIRINQHLKDLLGHVAGNISKEPPFSYMVLTIMALQSSQESSMSLKNILHYIQDQFPYYRTANNSWMHSVYQTINWSDIFVKTCSSSCHVKTSTDHSGCWTVEPATAEAILERTVDAQNRRAKGILRFDKSTSISPLSTNEKSNWLNKNICKPIEIQQSVKPGNNVFEDITEKLNVSKIKRRKSKGRDIKNEDVYSKIHLILKAAENPESQKKATFSELERENHKVKENVEKNIDVNVKINQHLKDLMGFVASNPLTEPPFSYMVLAVMALKSSPQPCLPLNDIFQFIRDNFPFYRSENESWMNAVKRTINWSNVFVKTCSSSCPAKKSQEHGGCWSVNPVTAEEILARAAEIYHRKGKENNSELVSNGQNIVNKVNNCEKDEASEVSINIEERFKDGNSHPSTNEELSSQTHDLQREHTNCVEPGVLSSCDLGGDSVASNSIEDVLQGKKHSLNTGFSDDVNDKNMCHQPGEFVTNEEQSYNDNVVLYCRDCNNLFICVFYLKHHQCSEGGSNPGYPCYLCHTNFTDVEEFCFHLTKNHNGIVNKHDPSSLCWTIKNCDFGSCKNHFKCKLCPAAFPGAELLEAHVKFVHN